MSQCSTIGDTMSCDTPYSAIGFRRKLFLQYPPPSKACVWTAIGNLHRTKWECSSDSLRHHTKHSSENPRAHKNKIGTSPPQPKIPSPLKTRNFMDIGFPAERTQNFRAPIKLAQAFPAPELRARIYGHEDFSEQCDRGGAMGVPHG